MRWRSLAAALAAVALVGCVGSPQEHPTSGGPDAPHVVATGPSQAPRTSPNTQPELILRANLSSAPARLHLVARIPFGPQRWQVGLIDDARRASLPTFPVSFAVASDGSIWLVDEVKRRLAHFAHDGRFIGQIGGIRFDRFHPQPQDIVAIGDSLYLLRQDHQHLLISSLWRYTRGRSAGHVRAEAAQGPVVVIRLISGTPRPTGLIGGAAGDPSSYGHGLRGYATLSMASAPNVIPIDGVPIDPTTHVAVTADPLRPDDRYLVAVSNAGGARSTIPVRVVVTPDAAERARRLSASVGMQVQAVLPRRTVAWVQVSPARPADAERYGGGTWLLVFATDGSPLVWERLAEPGLSDEWQVRRFAAGPDGMLYSMRAGRKGMEVDEVPLP
jgi:hypothetical protein